MTLPMALTFIILLAAVALFVSGRLRMDLVALLVLSALTVAGLVTPAEALSGFSNPAVVTVWAVFILSAGLSRTGVANVVGRHVLRLAGEGDVRLLVVIMVTAGVMSAFMNNVGVVALLLPVVMDVARRTGRAPSSLLIPLSFGALLGGLTTVIGTPPNILASDALNEAGLGTFGFFDFTPVGGAVALAGILFMATIGRRLLPAHDKTQAWRQTNNEALGALYDLDERLFVIRLPQETPLEGKTLQASRIGAALGLTVIGVMRDGHTDLAPGPQTMLRGGDRLLVTGAADRLAELRQRDYVVVAEESLSVTALTSAEIRLADISLSAQSDYRGQTLAQINFRGRYGANVLAIWREGSLRRTDLQDVPLGPEDTLLVQGTADQLQRLSDSSDFEVTEAGASGLYRLHERLVALQVPAGSPLVGKTLVESRLGDAFDLSVLGIIRNGETVLMPQPSTELQVGDTLLVQGRLEDVVTLRGLQALEVEPRAHAELDELESAHVGMVEAVLSPHTTLAGKTLRELFFREKYQLTVLAIWRAGRAYRSGLRDMQLRFGDTLLLYGPWEKLHLLSREPDFLVLTEELQEPLRLEKAPVSALLMLGMIVIVAAGWLPIAIAAVIAATLMVATGCLNMEEAYRHIEWRAVFLIAAMLPLGIALDSSGAARFVAEGVAAGAGGWGPLGLIAALFLLTSLATQVMPNSVVVVLVAPIALTTATDMGLSPQALLMTIALASAASFHSPVGHPANVLIMGPGGYRLSDYLRVGLPLSLLVLLVTLLVLPLVWPLFP